MGKMLDAVMAIFAVAVVVGCPIWALIHFWPF